MERGRFRSLEGETFPGTRKSTGGGEVAERGRRKRLLLREGDEEKDDRAAGSVERNPAAPNSSATRREPDPEDSAGEVGQREWALPEPEPKGSVVEDAEGGRRLSMSPSIPSLGFLEPPRRVELLLARPVVGLDAPNIESRMRPPIDVDPDELDLMGESAGL